MLNQQVLHVFLIITPTYIYNKVCNCATRSLKLKPGDMISLAAKFHGRGQLAYDYIDCICCIHQSLTKIHSKSGRHHHILRLQILVKLFLTVCMYPEEKVVLIIKRAIKHFTLQTLMEVHKCNRNKLLLKLTYIHVCASCESYVSFDQIKMKYKNMRPLIYSYNLHIEVTKGMIQTI